jgi:hypothetical protein
VLCVVGVVEGGVGGGQIDASLSFFCEKEDILSIITLHPPILQTEIRKKGKLQLSPQDPISSSSCPISSSPLTPPRRSKLVHLCFRQGTPSIILWCYATRFHQIFLTCIHCALQVSRICDICDYQIWIILKYNRISCPSLVAHILDLALSHSEVL